jgi:hypothetical protein
VRQIAGLASLFLVAVLGSGSARADAGTVTVHVRSDADGLQIERLDGDHAPIPCMPLCDTPLPRGGVYRIAGEGVVPSRRFTFDDGSADLTLKVDPGSNTQRAIGVGSAIAGVLLTGAAMLYIVGVNAVPVDDFAPPVDHTRDRFFVISLSSGVVLGLLGLTLIWTSDTTVTSSRGLRF